MNETERKTTAQELRAYAARMRKASIYPTHFGADLLDRAAGLLVGEPTEEQIEAARNGIHRKLLSEWAPITEALRYDQMRYDALLDDLAHAALGAGGVTPAAPSEPAPSSDREKLIADVQGMALSMCAPVVEVDEAKLSGVINNALDAWRGDERSEVFVARAIAEHRDEWLRGGGR